MNQQAIPFFFHGVDVVIGRVVAVHVLRDLTSATVCPHPIVQGDVYPCGVVLQQACGHVAIVRTNPDLEVWDMDGRTWYHDEVPKSPPGVGGAYRPERKVPPKAAAGTLLWHC
jgi:hypothetical protein